MVEAFQMVMGLFRQFLKGDILICFIWTIASTLFLPWNYIASTLFFALGKESLEDRDVNCPALFVITVTKVFWKLERSLYFRAVKCSQPKASMFDFLNKTPSELKG